MAGNKRTARPAPRDNLNGIGDPAFTQPSPEEINVLGDPVEVVGELEVPAEFDGTVTLKIPLADSAGAYATRHVDMRLSPRRAAVLNRIFHGLRDRPLPIGASQAERVDSPARAIMYLLDSAELAAQGDVPTSGDVPN